MDHEEGTLPLDKIVVRGLTKVFPASYGSITALAQLDLVIPEHEFCVLLGLLDAARRR